MFLEDNTESLKNTYKTVRLYPELQSTVNGNEKLQDDKLLRQSFKPCVSFNTVPSYMGDDNGNDGLDFPGVQIPTEYTMEEYYDDESGYVSNNMEYFLRNNYLTDNSTFGGSPPPKNLSDKAAALNSMFRIAQNGKIVRVDYPTTPTITNDAIIVNRAQPGWRPAWLARKSKIEKKIEDKQTHFRFPHITFPQQSLTRKRIISEDGYTPISKDERRRERVLHEKVGFPNSPKTILCHVSGRRHTWVALDWAVRELAQTTDHIVVVANIPRFATANYGRSRSKNRFGVSNGNACHRSRSAEPKSAYITEKQRDSAEWTSGYSSEMVSNKLEDILTYIAVIVPQDIKIKVTVEIVIGKTKKILVDAMNVYTPDFCISTTLRWQRTDNLILWKAKNLTDILCTKYPIPVVVIPVKRMYEFEAALQKDFAPKENKISSSGDVLSRPVDQSSITDEQTPQSPTICLEASDMDSESEISDSDSDGASVSIASKEDLMEATKKHREEISEGLKELDAKQHETAMRKNTDKLDLITQTSLTFAMQVQSMNREDREAGFTQLKRVITGEKENKTHTVRSMVDVGDYPKKSRNKHVPNTKPRASQIKFASNVNSRDGNRALGNSKIKVVSPESSPPPPMNPRSSHDEPLRKTKSSQPTTIRKVRSASNISRVKSNESMASSGSSSSSRKKGGFLSIFRHSGSRSRSTSRRNSDASDTDAVSLNDNDSGKKRRSRLFGFS